jgi:DNA-binding GntR family transcriptional regulator
MADNGVMLQIYDSLQDRQHLSIVRSAERITGNPQQVLAEHRSLLHDARRGHWTAFARHLSDHQARSHGLGPT